LAPRMKALVATMIDHIVPDASMLTVQCTLRPEYDPTKLRRFVVSHADSGRHLQARHNEKVKWAIARW